MPNHPPIADNLNWNGGAPMPGVSCTQKKLITVVGCPECGMPTHPVMLLGKPICVCQKCLIEMNANLPPFPDPGLLLVIDLFF